MAKSPKIQLREFVSKVEMRIQFAQNPSILREVAEFARGVIVKRTRLGFGVDSPGATSQHLEALSKKYVRFRELSSEFIHRTNKKGKLVKTKKKNERFDVLKSKNKPTLNDKITRPAMSNLTFTGQLLDSLEVTRVVKGQAVIEPTGDRKKEPNRKNTLSNKKLAQYVTEAGRAFLNLSALEANQVFRFWRQKFGDLVGRFR